MLFATRDAKKVRDGSKFAGQEELGEDGLDFVQTAKALAAAPRTAPENASRRKRTKMKPPDPDAPKRPKNAWMFFMSRNRERVRLILLHSFDSFAIRDKKLNMALPLVFLVIRSGTSSSRSWSGLATVRMSPMPSSRLS